MNQQIQNDKAQQSGKSLSDARLNQLIEPITMPSGSIIRDGKHIPLAQRLDPARLIVDLYNRNPSDLRRRYRVTTVSIPIDSQGSLWVGKAGSVILQEDFQGNYWVIQDGNDSYLVPKDGIRLNPNSLEPLAMLCNFENQADVTCPLKLTKVAVVSRISGSEGWQLEEKGSLYFDSDRPLQSVAVPSTVFSPIKPSLPDKVRSIPDSTSKLQDKINQLEQVSLQQKSENYRLQAVISQLKAQLRQLTAKIEKGHESSDRPQPSFELPANPPEFDSFKSFLLSQYTRDPKLLRSLAIEVSLTENSLGNYRLVQAVVFEEGIGSYWLFRPAQQQQAYLLPKANFRFNTNNLDSVKVCFNFSSDSEIYYSKFTVVSPAIVLHVGQGKEWQLQERGWLEFQSTSQENPDA